MVAPSSRYNGYLKFTPQISLCNRKAFGIPQTWKGEWKGNVPSMGTDTPLGKAQHRLTAQFLIGHSPVHSGWVSRHLWCAPSPKTAKQTNPISLALLQLEVPLLTSKGRVISPLLQSGLVLGQNAAEVRQVNIQTSALWSLSASLFTTSRSSSYPAEKATQRKTKHPGRQPIPTTRQEREDNLDLLDPAMLPGERSHIRWRTAQQGPSWLPDPQNKQ